MELTLTRIAKRKDYTIGRLCIAPSFPPPQGEGNTKEEKTKVSPRGGDLEGAFFCHTLEPTWRDYEHGAYKIKGRSAIPEGRYAVVISYSPKFQKWLPLLLGGPEFNKRWQGIRIHAGNTAKDTQGCILVGVNPAIEREKASDSECQQGRPEVNRVEGQVLDSNLWLHRLKRRITEAKARGEAVWLTIQ